MKLSANRFYHLSFRLELTLLGICAAISLMALPPTANAAVVDSIEFYNTKLNHYFRTESASEADGIDKGSAGPDWVRTGQNYKVWRTAADAPAGAYPVCRFYSYGYNTHFFTASPGECKLLKDNEVRDRAAAIAAGQTYSGWQFEAIVSYALFPVAGKCAAGTQPVYRNYAGFTINHRFSTALPVYQDMNDQTWIPEGANLCVPGASSAETSDAYRLLQQATFGATEAQANRIQSIGITAWVDEQLAMPKSSYPQLPYVTYISPTNCTNDNTKPATDPQNICYRDNYTLFPIQMAFLQNALGGDDQLRQRVAFALAQILVTSGVEIYHPYGMGRYQQIMLDNAFGNYKDLLAAVTLSPAMGRYLDMANSKKPDIARGISANENYGREIMQLFSIGLYELNLDGTIKRDANGGLVPSYSQTTVENFARIFTGWTYQPVGGGVPTTTNGVNYEFPMAVVAANHDTGNKTLLNGVVTTAGQTPDKDLSDALNNLFTHANTAPFISKQLIQKLVSGDPAPAYVARIAAVFNDNGQGVRGDLKAVVRAILLDSEARGEIKTAATYGRLKDPVLLATSTLRGLGATSDGYALLRGGSNLSGLGLNLFNSPTVFNYYSPDYQISSGKVGPEFAILTSTTSFARANFFNTYIMGNAIAPDATVQGGVGTSINWAPWQALATTPAALVDKLSVIFAHGALSATAQKKIVDAVNTVVATDTLTRAKTAAYLVLSASQSQVEH